VGAWRSRSIAGHSGCASGEPSSGQALAGRTRATRSSLRLGSQRSLFTVVHLRSSRRCQVLLATYSAALAGGAAERATRRWVGGVVLIHRSGEHPGRTPRASAGNHQSGSRRGVARYLQTTAESGWPTPSNPASFPCRPPTNWQATYLPSYEDRHRHSAAGATEANQSWPGNLRRTWA
jgi:hypothetical protein